MDADDGWRPLVEPNDDSAYENLFQAPFENDVRRTNGGDPSWIAQLNVSELREQLAGFELAVAARYYRLRLGLRGFFFSQRGNTQSTSLQLSRYLGWAASYAGTRSVS